MKKQVLENAEKDIIAIKDVIYRTTDVFISISKIFIGWGLFFLILCIIVIPICLFRFKISDFIKDYPVMTVIPLILVALASFASYLIISKTKGFKGLSKPLLAIWLFIITYVTVYPAVGYLLALPGYSKTDMAIFLYFIPYLDVGTLLLAFAFGLLCIRVFTNLKFVGILAFIYSILAFLSMIFLHFIGLRYDELYFTISIILYCAIMPVTFVILGGYLEFYRMRRN